MKKVILYCLLIPVFAGLDAQSMSTYDHIPDATYDDMRDRLSLLNTEIPLEFNERVKGFIDYFTV